jgi:hypothetical protein
MTTPARVTICSIVTCDTPVLPAALKSLLEAGVSPAISLHLGFARAPLGWRHTFGRLCPSGSLPSRAVLPGGVERFYWTTEGGAPVRAWVTDRDISEARLTTALLTDVAVTTDYLIWFDPRCRLDDGWWEALLPLLDKGIDYIGRPAWVEYSPRDAERLQSRSWYRGVPLERRQGKPGVCFMSGFWGLRTACLREVEGSGERNWSRWATEQAGGWAELLGEIARQLNWSRAEHDMPVCTAPDSMSSTSMPSSSLEVTVPNPQ